ncbi:hypothetical protein Hypma_005838 [Hypsizygus marmoreus]|uniref:Zinc finger PHD-type domain-containing protein n=1 Tax=Hypsizygus marmoreus TaxID=39966 RepID=A0A369KBL6_HYPMA|nr:hypothetical protein Hypma_005838 [Hypsizygus marmoreus]
MARTTQKARKSTGAPAPRVSLTEIELDKEQATRSSKRLIQKSKQSAGAMVKAAKRNKEDLHNEFCTRCKNGGSLLKCDYCSRAVCIECITPPAEAVNTGQFRCPHCHLHPDGQKKRAIAPYKAFSSIDVATVLTGGATQRETFPVCNAGPVIVLSIRLASIPADGAPAALVYHNLYTYMPGEVVRVELAFDFGSHEGVLAFGDEIDGLIKRVKGGDLKGYDAFAVYIMDHTDTERGDLHFTIDNKGADEVSTVLDALLPSRLMKLIARRGPARSTLTLLACGAVVTEKAARKSLKAFVERSPFVWVMAFSQPNFQPSIANHLVMDAAIAWFSHSKQPETTFGDQQRLGAHTDVFIIKPGEPVTRFLWSHVARQPFGVPTPLQCGRCMSLLSWRKPSIKKDGKADALQISMKCKYCEYVFTVDRPDGLVKFTKGKISSTGHGDWYKQIL